MVFLCGRHLLNILSSLRERVCVWMRIDQDNVVGVQTDHTLLAGPCSFYLLHREARFVVDHNHPVVDPFDAVQHFGAADGHLPYVAQGSWADSSVCRDESIQC